MSGIKYSKLELEREQKTRQVALQKITGLGATLSCFDSQAVFLLGSIPSGVKESFQSDMQQICELLSSSAPSYQSYAASSVLNIVVSDLERLVDSRRKAIGLLCAVRDEKRETLASELQASFEELRADWNGVKVIVNNWCPGEFETQSASLESVYKEIDQGNFVSVTNKIKNSRENCNVRGSFASARELQDCERRFVLEALNNVCTKEMGWKQLSPPSLQLETEPGSPIIVKYNTYSDGIIEFNLKLDGIETKSDISNEKNGCYKEFDNISEKLKKFGVSTCFRKEGDEGRLPELIRKGELDEPDGTEAFPAQHKEI